MKKRFVLCVLASTLAGCKAEYNFDEVSAQAGTLGSPHALYVETRSGKLLNGTVTHKIGDRVLQSFKVENGRAVGEWKKFDRDGRLLVEGQLQAGVFVGARKTWCQGKFASQLDSLMTEEGGVRSEQSYDCATGLQIGDSTVIPGREVRVGEQREWRVIDGKQKLTLLETFASDGSDRLDGLVEHYDYKGELKDRATYRNGELEGVLETWVTADGTRVPADKVTYSAGRKNGPSETYFSHGWPAGTVAEKGNYKDDRQVGVWIWYQAGKASVRDYDNPPNRTPMAKQLWKAAHGDYRASDRNRAIRDLDGFAYLLKSSGIDINQRLTDEDRPLITTATDNAYDYLVSAGADPMGRDSEGNTRLMTCLTNLNVLNCGLEHMIMLAGKEDLKAHSVYGDTALSLFCRQADELKRRHGVGGREQALFQALLNGSDVNAKAYGGETALHACIAEHNLSFAEALAGAGANLDATDFKGTPALAAVFLENYRAGESSYRIRWSEERIRFVARYQGQSDFTFDTPVPAFGKTFRQLVLENGDTASAMLIDALVGTAKG
ncbi:hypothetical protein [Pseudomonas vanderleydeniana]|uniref:Ankyrin repeat domain-containing protein n=1 Tax=Pseudomonas vanderleydeniana TaxID=2745495 RepID=A0A9E6PRJ0_9PSED|nr:hypothetical protein [Pseudomonas vanderleydeniana]QXI30721.1 hypothetical protein HU752_012575 [Pseudomonas vanderleydeniana]